MAQEPESQDAEQIFCSQCGNRIPRSVAFCPHCGTANNPSEPSTVPAVPSTRATGHIKYRNMFVQVLLYIITFGIYGIYWYYVTLEELDIANGVTEGSGCLWTILYIFPIANLFAYWHHAGTYAKFVDDKYPGIAIFILWLVFSPVVWFLVQLDLNRAARSSV